MTTYDPYPYATAHDIRAHYQSVPVAVLIPAAQSLVTGFSLAASAAAISWLVEVGHPWRIGVSAGALGQTAAWLLLIYGWRGMLYKMERALGIDHHGRCQEINGSQAEWHNLRDTLITRGLAYWINPRARAQGFALNVSGKNVLRRYAAESGIIEDLQK
jgi:hypothetical protein